METKKMMVQFCSQRLYYRIETINYQLLLQMARMEMDWNLKKIGNFIWSSQSCTSWKNYHGVLSHQICNSAGTCRQYTSKGTKQWF